MCTQEKGADDLKQLMHEIGFVNIWILPYSKKKMSFLEKKFLSKVYWYIENKIQNFNLGTYEFGVLPQRKHFI